MGTDFFCVRKENKGQWKFLFFLWPMVMNSVEEFLPPFVDYGVTGLWVVIAVVGLWRGWFRQGHLSIGDLMKRIGSRAGAVAGTHAPVFERVPGLIC